jgi:SAM-dependent methyltransferase
VLIPRPETELLIDVVLDALRDEPGGIVVDVGTGSGAIALALANEGRFDRVIGTDVSLDALGSAATLGASVRSLRKRGRHVQVGLLPPSLGEPVVPGARRPGEWGVLAEVPAQRVRPGARGAPGAPGEPEVRHPTTSGRERHAALRAWPAAARAAPTSPPGASSPATA